MELKKHMNGTKRALVTGISGQDGSYLAEFLLNKGYEVWGLLRRHSVPENQTSRLEELGILDDLNLVYGDMTDLPSLLHILREVHPAEIYNLAAQSHVRISFDQPAFTTHTDAVGVLNLLELYAYNLCKVYRSSYAMFISNGILFNHESPRRGLNFVTNKVVAAAVNISKGKQENLALGNLNATRDWGHAKDYVRAMWLMLQHDEPDDFVCAMGESHSIKDLCAEVFSELDMDYREYVTIDTKYFRPTELHDLKGDSTKLRETLGWSPSYTFRSMIEEMVKARL